ncbi:discoidin domain-containing protein [Lysinibacillus sp. FSL W8-0992]|uniref:discoidin domain-containing protein n=1 Tax=Lysinibacillus sp. FSL W8-0992 TaxID=2954643 RepID=UPI0030F7A1F6
MANFGDTMNLPEKGWKRIEETDPCFTYEGVWGSRSNSSYSGGSQKTQSNNILGNKIKFKFFGSKIRIITSIYPTYTPKVKITIDGVEEYYSLQGTQVNISLVYEKLNLPLNLHYVEVEKVTNGGYDPDFIWDAIDIDADGFVADINYKPKRLILKNSIIDEHFSLSDKTIIHLPNAEKKTIAQLGIWEENEIILDAPFDKHYYINNSPINNVNCKIFTQNISKINNLRVKENNENKNFEPVYYWYDFIMTSNSSPEPLIASGSSLYSSNYDYYKVFNGTNVNWSDSWTSSSPQAYIQLDFNEIKKINMFSITTWNEPNSTSSPKRFSITASNNGVDFVSIFNEITFTEEWPYNTEKIFILDEVKNFRFFRINIEESFGAPYVSIGKIKVGYKKEVNN